MRIEPLVHLVRSLVKFWSHLKQTVSPDCLYCPDINRIYCFAFALPDNWDSWDCTATLYQVQLRDKTLNTFVLISPSTRSCKGCGYAPTLSESFTSFTSESTLIFIRSFIPLFGVCIMHGNIKNYFRSLNNGVLLKTRPSKMEI